MPVAKYRDVGAVPDSARATSPLEGVAAACELAELCGRVGVSRRAPRGVRRFRSVEEADAARQQWEAPAAKPRQATR